MLDVGGQELAMCEEVRISGGDNILIEERNGMDRVLMEL